MLSTRLCATPGCGNCPEPRDKHCIACELSGAAFQSVRPQPQSKRGQWVHQVRYSRRRRPTVRLVLTRGGLTIDRAMIRFFADGQQLKLKPMMYRILEYLFDRFG